MQLLPGCNSPRTLDATRRSDAECRRRPFSQHLGLRPLERFLRDFPGRHRPGRDRARVPFGRVLGNVDGVLNGASTAVVTSLTNNGLNATSSDVFVTNRGDMLTATGAVTLTPIPGSSSEFRENATLTITGGSGKYKGASGTITLEGQAVSDSSGGGTFDVIYQGSVCGPNVKGDGD